MTITWNNGVYIVYSDLELGRTMWQKFYLPEVVYVQLELGLVLELNGYIDRSLGQKTSKFRKYSHASETFSIQYTVCLWWYRSLTVPVYCILELSDYDITVNTQQFVSN